jgi:hypothetical protein
MKTIGSQELGFFCGDFGYDPETKTLLPQEHPSAGVSHLSAVFGLVEVCAELIGLIDVPEFERAWLQYCTLYNGSREDHVAAFGHPLRGTSLRAAHSRLTAYAAQVSANPRLAERAWSEFHETREPRTIDAIRVDGPTTLNPVEEASWVSTNDSAQWGLAAIQNLALIPDAL